MHLSSLHLEIQDSRQPKPPQSSCSPHTANWQRNQLPFQLYTLLFKVRVESGVPSCLHKAITTKCSVGEGLTDKQMLFHKIVCFSGKLYRIYVTLKVEEILRWFSMVSFF
ncbi:hypothetical protein XENOCAPTIV_010841 [Xenoophorus captivus]|uniref:Uncharacterized protein n=1 Tax=Xenoophorus captivus TaxID=1517983 RepID=A0ABV0RQ54_9TELE